MTIYVNLYQTPVLKRLLGRPQRWRWTAINAGNHKVLAVSSEAYTNRQDAVDAIQQLFGTGSDVYRREAEKGNELLRLAQQPAA